jgi:hypothetical protein
MKTKQLDLFAPEPKKEVPEWARPMPRTPKWMRESDPVRPIAANGVGEWSARNARLNSKKGQDCLMRQESTGSNFRHELAQYDGEA